MKQSRRYAYWGAFLVLAYLAQDFFQLKWAWFERLQDQSEYRIVSGLLLVGYVAAMWHLSILRARGRLVAATQSYRRHKILGAMAPLFFYLHTTHFGYAYLFFLSAIFFGNIVLGFLNREIINIHQKWFSFAWMILHVTFSVIIVFLAFYHIFIVVSYE